VYISNMTHNISFLFVIMNFTRDFKKLRIDTDIGIGWLIQNLTGSSLKC
jgi:hypothetical protein